MGKFPDIKRLPCKSKCGWTGVTAFGGHCPFLLHSLYPYFLGLLYGADMQEIWACCPAEKSVDVVIRKENNTGQFIEDAQWFIYAEVVAVGDCPHGYKVGAQILFPTCSKKEFICPAGINNIFPFLNLEIPPCINMDRLRCPDWKEDIFYKVSK